VTTKPKGLADLEALEKVFAALAHTSRRSILLVVHARGGSMTSKDIAERFDCAWPTITRHLGILEGAGLLHVERRGRERLYRIDPGRLHDVAGGWIGRFGPVRASGAAVKAGPRSARRGPCEASTSFARPTRLPAATPRQ
jgi:DNA-binding transcriptional ArsR family regulator